MSAEDFIIFMNWFLSIFVLAAAATAAIVYLMEIHVFHRYSGYKHERYFEERESYYLNNPKRYELLKATCKACGKPKTVRVEV